MLKVSYLCRWEGSAKLRQRKVGCEGKDEQGKYFRSFLKGLSFEILKSGGGGTLAHLQAKLRLFQKGSGSYEILTSMRAGALALALRDAQKNRAQFA